MAIPRTWRKAFLKSTTVFHRPELPLIIFGCEFHHRVCQACGLAGEENEAVACRLALIWALGKGHWPKGSWYAREGP